MIHQPVQPRRGTIDVARSSLAVEILLNIYAVILVAVLARIVLLSASIVPTLPLSSWIYRVTDPLVSPFASLPGANMTLLGDIMLPDATVFVLLLMVPLAALARTAGAR
ncbi:MAG TPA: hypothetical protein VGR16_09955 [Thermomicrobiales bacterium]|nr:hypothetical protein [Thermomicrobiales bacterium]